MNKTINQLIEYGLKNHMISKEDESYAVNLLLDLLKIDQFEKEETEEVSILQILVEWCRVSDNSGAMVLE